MPPIVLIIAGIHAYLGLHIVERGVIFVNLSPAQIASLGAAIAVFQGFETHDPAGGGRVYRGDIGAGKMEIPIEEHLRDGEGRSTYGP